MLGAKYNIYVAEFDCKVSWRHKHTKNKPPAYAKYLCISTLDIDEYDISYWKPVVFSFAAVML